MPLKEGVEFETALTLLLARTTTPIPLVKQAQIDSIEEGVWVKVCAANEWFWMIVGTVDGDQYTGLINNDLVATEVHGLKDGEEITIHKDNIFDVYTIDEL